MGNTVRKLVRPFISVSFVLMCAWLTYKGSIEAKEILTLTGIIVAFHFGERAALKQPKETTDEPE